MQAVYMGRSYATFVYVQSAACCLHCKLLAKMVLLRMYFVFEYVQSQVTDKEGIYVCQDQLFPLK